MGVNAKSEMRHALSAPPSSRLPLLLLTAGAERRGVPALCAQQRHSHGGVRLAQAPPDASAQKKRHALLTFGFVGTGFHGLQSQRAESDPEAPTVADGVRKALLDTGFIAPSNYTPLKRTKWTLASRTDKGVHAACAMLSQTYTEEAKEAAAAAAAAAAEEEGAE